MADYVYSDNARAQIVYANQPDIAAYAHRRLYCRNPRCNAHMFIHNANNPAEAYFQAHGTPQHFGYCGCQGALHFNRYEHDETAFFMPDAIQNLMRIHDNNPQNHGQGGRGHQLNLYPPRTLRQIYQMCVNTPPTDTYNNIPIHEIFAGEDTAQYYLNGIEGFRIAECSFYRYSEAAQTITMNFPFHGWNYNVELWFYDNEIFENAVDVLADYTHKKISVVAGEFHTHADGTCFVDIYANSQFYQFPQ